MVRLPAPRASAAGLGPAHMRTGGVDPRPRELLMIFEQAIDDAQKLFLFDKRSQQKLHEMAESAEPRSRDRSLILLTQAAFAYYNRTEQPGSDLQTTMRQVQALLREAKLFRHDRVFTTMALKLEVDVLLQAAATSYLEAVKTSASTPILTDEDQHALSICETLLRNMPASFAPLPTNWYSSLIPLFPTFRAELIDFYSQRGRDHRSGPLAAILQKLRHEMVVCAGIIHAKKFILDHRIKAANPYVLRTWLLAGVREVMQKVEEALPTELEVVSDIALPRGIAQGQLDAAVQNVNAQIEQSKAERDVRKYTGSLLQLGILNFLRGAPVDAIRGLVLTLRATGRINPEDKKIRQYRHEEFPDIPFMIGSSYLKLALADGQQRGPDRELLNKARTSLFRALVLQPRFHQAFVNALLCASLASDPEQERELTLLYLNWFENDLTQVNGVLFRNMALVNHRNAFQTLTPEAVRMLLLSAFCGGGQLTKGKKMLQELKTLYVLSAHDHSAEFLDHYRNSLRAKDAEFIADLQDAGVHSALLFYIAHAFTSRCLAPGKYDTELVLDHAQLDQGIDLNTESLYFNPKNGSALRLVETQAQIVQYAMQRTDKRWDSITGTMGQRFQFYEEYLRQEKSLKMLKDRLASVNLTHLVPEVKVSQTTLLRMDGTISGPQRERLQQRVKAT